MYRGTINLLQFFSYVFALYLLCKDNMSGKDLIVIIIIMVVNLIIDDVLENKYKNIKDEKTTDNTGV